MPQFFFVYHGGKQPETEDEGKKVMADWMAWFEGMGDAVKMEGAPAGLSKTVHAGGVDDNGGANPISGVSMIEAADMDAALAHAANCPMVRDGSGSVEVAQVMDM